MKLFRIVKTELKKVFTSFGFYSCVIITFLLCFTYNLSYDYVTNENLSIFNVFTSHSRSELLENVDYCSLNVFRVNISQWVILFIPIIASFSFVPLFCDERNSKMIRYSTVRTSKLTFNFGKFLSAFLAGGLAILIGHILFGIATYFMFPSLSEYSIELQDSFVESLAFMEPKMADLYMSIGSIGLIAPRLFEFFLYGAISSIPVVVLAAISKNIYVIICVPFLMKYLIDQTMNKISLNVYMNNENPDKLLQDFLIIFDTNATQNLFLYSDYIIKIIVANLVYVAIAYVIFSFIMNRRLDLGE